MDSLDGFLTLPQLSDDIIFMITAMEFAVFGGVVNWLMGEKRSAAGLFTGIIVAGFVGLLTGELCRHYGITGPGAFFLIGSSGLAAETLVKMFKRFTISRIEALIKDDSKKNDNNKLGKILIEEYGIDIDDIRKSLRDQNSSFDINQNRIKLGEILVKHGIVTEEILKSALDKQFNNQYNIAVQNEKPTASEDNKQESSDV